MMLKCSEMWRSISDLNLTDKPEKVNFTVSNSTVCLRKTGNFLLRNIHAIDLLPTGESTPFL